jgi:hypothetical protein
MFVKGLKGKKRADRDEVSTSVVGAGRILGEGAQWIEAGFTSLFYFWALLGSPAQSRIRLPFSSLCSFYLGLLALLMILLASRK